jgi:hypothetical protein
MTIVAPCGGGCRCSGAIRKGVIMADEVSRESARDPQDLERLVVSRERAGGVNGMAALYEPFAILMRHLTLAVPRSVEAEVAEIHAM